MIHIGIFIVLAAACYFKGNWRNWREYYPTILFFIIGNAVSNNIFFNYPLWLYKTPEWPSLGHTYIDLFWVVMIFPSIIILFLTYLPKSKIKIPLYILCWTAAYALLEFVLNKLDGIQYFNGWSGWATLLFDIALFLFLYLHYKKSPIAWLMTAAAVPLFLLLVKMPLDKIK